MALVRLRRWASCSWIIWGRCCWAPPLPASTKSATPSWAATKTSLRATTACRSRRCRCLVQKGYRNGKLWEIHSNVVDSIIIKPYLNLQVLDIWYIYASRFSWNRTMGLISILGSWCCSTCWVLWERRFRKKKNSEIVMRLWQSCKTLIWTFLNDLTYGTWRWPV